MRLLELTCRLIASCSSGPVWGAMDREMREHWLESVADTPEWIDLMAFVDEVQGYRARKEDEHISVLGQALSRAGLGWNDKSWASLEALARKVETEVDHPRGSAAEMAWLMGRSVDAPHQSFWTEENVPTKRYRVVNVEDDRLDPMVCREANGLIVTEIKLHGEDCRCAFLELR